MRLITAACDLAAVSGRLAKRATVAALALPAFVLVAAARAIGADRRPRAERSNVDTSRWWCGRCRRYVHMPHVHPVPREYRS